MPLARPAFFLLRTRPYPRKGLNPEKSLSLAMPKKASRKKGGKKSAKKKAYYSGRKERRAKK